MELEEGGGEMSEAERIVAEGGSLLLRLETTVHQRRL